MRGGFKPIVFVFQDLGMCENTEIRHETISEMLQIEQRLVSDYLSLGFTVIKVPFLSIKDRADFILKYIGQKDAENTSSKNNVNAEQVGVDGILPREDADLKKEAIV